MQPRHRTRQRTDEAEIPIIRTSTKARRMESRGAPTSETTAMRFAPIAMAIALGVEVTASPMAKHRHQRQGRDRAATGVMSESRSSVSFAALTGLG